MLTVGDKAPIFSAPDQTGTVRSLTDYAGQWILLYFYPEDNTEGCTIEACTLRDAMPDFGTLGMAVIGVSPDSVASHKGFAKQYNLPFPILADPDKKIINAYGVWGEKNLYGHKSVGVRRMSYLINPQGGI